jgi:ubiquinol-cytochrome c reductase iron-sulfur subunit
MNPVDKIKQRRRLVVAITSAIGGFGLLAAVSPFLKSFAPSGRTKVAGAPVQFDMKDLLPGQQITVK